jgi:hypothetical protein
MSKKKYPLLGPAATFARIMYYAGIALLTGGTLIFAVIKLLMPVGID